MSRPTITRISRFLDMPLEEKRNVLSFKLKQLQGQAFSFIPTVKKIEPGFLFLAWNDTVHEAILNDAFEKTERHFVRNFLKPGMTVFDVGAYFGIYSLTASVKVGRTGSVIAFEPSPYQR